MNAPGANPTVAGVRPAIAGLLASLLPVQSVHAADSPDAIDATWSGLRFVHRTRSAR